MGAVVVHLRPLRLKTLSIIVTVTNSRGSNYQSHDLFVLSLDEKKESIISIWFLIIVIYVHYDHNLSYPLSCIMVCNEVLRIISVGNFICIEYYNL